MKTILKWTGIVFGLLIGLSLVAGVAVYPTGLAKLTRPYPGIQVESITIPADADSVARGRHVAVIWGCTKCHGENLGGALLADYPILGTIPAPNLTSGTGGIAGTYSDSDWVRAIRHGVGPDDGAEIFMINYSTLSDQDLGDLLAYLKQIPTVDSDLPAMQYGPINPMAYGAGVLTLAAEAIDHNLPRPVDPAPGATIDYGRYLWSICSECHSPRLSTELGGSAQEDFVRAVRTGVRPNGRRLPTAMAPTTFGELSDMELAAMWRFLQGSPAEDEQE